MSPTSCSACSRVKSLWFVSTPMLTGRWSRVYSMTASPAVASPGSGSSMMRIGSGAPSAGSGSSTAGTSTISTSCHAGASCEYRGSPVFGWVGLM